MLEQEIQRTKAERLEEIGGTATPPEPQCAQTHCKMKILKVLKDS